MSTLLASEPQNEFGIVGLSASSELNRYAQATIIGFDRAINSMLRLVERLFQRDRFPTPIRTAITSFNQTQRLRFALGAGDRSVLVGLWRAIAAHQASALQWIGFCSFRA